jgi:hypothetical protein
VASQEGPGPSRTAWPAACDTRRGSSSPGSVNRPLSDRAACSPKGTRQGQAGSTQKERYSRRGEPAAPGDPGQRHAQCAYLREKGCHRARWA